MAALILRQLRSGATITLGHFYNIDKCQEVVQNYCHICLLPWQDKTSNSLLHRCLSLTCLVTTTLENVLYWTYAGCKRHYFCALSSRHNLFLLSFIVFCCTTECTQNIAWTHIQRLVKGPMKKDIWILGNHLLKLEMLIHSLWETCKKVNSHSKHSLEYQSPEVIKLYKLKFNKSNRSA